jgi:phosphoribosylformimino-5-aminoimidazole carboxamide ribotide isomerase
MIIREAPLSEVWQLRQEVMYPKASIDAVQLYDDPVGLHFGLYEDDRLLTVISLFVSEQTLQFRKFATRLAFQQKGYGSSMLQFVMEWARDNGCKFVWCNARISATELYKRFGMKSIGDSWEKNSIKYIKMQKEL